MKVDLIQIYKITLHEVAPTNMCSNSFVTRGEIKPQKDNRQALDTVGPTADCRLPTDSVQKSNLQ